jgi:hypothetical protein
MDRELAVTEFGITLLVATLSQWLVCVRAMPKAVFKAGSVFHPYNQAAPSLSVIKLS